MQEEYADLRAGDRLRNSVEHRGESLAAFSRASGIPYRSLQDYMVGRSKPGFDQLAKLAAAGLDIGYVLTGFPTGAVDHPSPEGIDPIDLGKGTTIPGRHFLRTAITSIAQRAGDGLDVRAWLEAWSEAEREVHAPHVSPERRAAAIFAIAAEIAQGVKQRLRAVGLV